MSQRSQQQRVFLLSLAQHYDFLYVFDRHLKVGNLLCDRHTISLFVDSIDCGPVSAKGYEK